jgi:hypothetical protein
MAPFVHFLSSSHKAVLRALCKPNHPPLILEEIAATASVSFEDTWYVVLELIQLRLMTAVGIGFFGLTTEGYGPRLAWLDQLFRHALMPTRAEYYRVKAEECAQRAKTARDPETRRSYEHLAQQWLDLEKYVVESGGDS